MPSSSKGRSAPLGDMPHPGAVQALLSGFEHYNEGNRKLMIEALVRDQFRREALLDAIEARRLTAVNLGEQARKRWSIRLAIVLMSGPARSSRIERPRPLASSRHRAVQSSTTEWEREAAAGARRASRDPSPPFRTARTIPIKARRSSR